MKTLAVIGLQFGDEGKGKIVDYIARYFDIVARYQGGANAGHTVKIGDSIYKFHLIPSGILNHKISVLGNGMVIDPLELQDEINMLKGFNPKKYLKISERAHVVMPYHKELDRNIEELKGSEKVGTTGMGIGPAYEDKYARIGIRIIDLLDKDLLKKKIEIALRIRGRYLNSQYDPVKLAEEYHKLGLNFKKNIIDTSDYINRSLKSGKTILFEGAQGTHLDVDFGMYPYVTSSNTSAAGILTGIGTKPCHVRKIIGVMKAYTTRVGEGPFPTELRNDIGNKILTKGNEYGTTTGRPRRVGWLDLVLVKYAIDLSGVSEIAISKIDILSGLDEVKVAHAYKINGKTTRNLPVKIEDLQKAEPVYKTFKGWEYPTNGKKNIPDEMMKYLNFIEKYTETRISIISLGAKREDTVLLKRI
ncbi:MAG: adenylosuccinate synthase [Thermoplasmata archaeon]